jgi:ferrous iron transport protein A
VNAHHHAEHPSAEALQGAFPLTMATDDATVKVVAVRGGEGLARRLGDMGVVVGAELTIRQRQGAGLVVALGGTRYALGGGMAHKIWVRAAGAALAEQSR